MARALVLVVAALAATAPLTACGHDDGGDGTTSTRPAAESRRDGLVAFTACLERQGVDVPDAPPQGQGGAPPFDPRDPGVRKALEACRGELPDGAAPPSGAPPGAAP